MTTVLGWIEEFEPDKEEWSVYVERLQHIFQANGIAEEDKKRAVLLSVMGAGGYKLVRSLVAPAKPGEKLFKVLTEVMEKHYNPIPLEIVQRYMLFRQPSESVSTFVSELCSIAEHCKFGETLEAMLRDWNK